MAEHEGFGRRIYMHCYNVCRPGRGRGYGYSNWIRMIQNGFQWRVFEANVMTFQVREGGDSA
jgi:hypothetical protein